ncbi:hypothetical protein ACTD5D_09770 [Nocardia takedensis]|uniref:hypothetical protein n=1 Tax=Nocardia takedensis TaxID=259390 RepID=UPI003F76CB8A
MPEQPSRHHEATAPTATTTDGPPLSASGDAGPGQLPVLWRCTVIAFDDESAEQAEQFAKSVAKEWTLNDMVRDAMTSTANGLVTGLLGALSRGGGVRNSRAALRIRRDPASGMATLEVWDTRVGVSPRSTDTRAGAHRPTIGPGYRIRRLSCVRIGADLRDLLRASPRPGGEHGRTPVHGTQDPWVDGEGSHGDGSDPNDSGPASSGSGDSREPSHDPRPRQAPSALDANAADR